MTDVTTEQDLYSSIDVFYPNQDHIIDMLRLEGYDISVRTLRYWRTVCTLPQLTRMGTQMCYSMHTVAKIRELCIETGRYIGLQLFKKVLVTLILSFSLIARTYLEASLTRLR